MIEDTLPLFIAMAFSGTLENATLIGASSNTVGAGLCTTSTGRVAIVRLLRFGLPITCPQPMASALYVIYVFPLLV